MWPSFPLADTAKASEKFDFTLSQTSSTGVARPFAAKNRMRCPENQVKTSSGWPWRYEVIVFWNVPWSTVLTFTLVPPLAEVNAATISARHFLGAGSD